MTLSEDLKNSILAVKLRKAEARVAELKHVVEVLDEEHRRVYEALVGLWQVTVNRTTPQAARARQIIEEVDP